MNLLTNGDFESGCSGWIGDGTPTPSGGMASLTPSGIAHGGTGSCQVCVQAGYTVGIIKADPDPPSAPLVGQTYSGWAWVRALPGAVSTPRVRPFVEFRKASGLYYGASGPGALIDQTWQRVIATYQPGSDALAVTFWATVGAFNEPVSSGECFLVDDVALVRTQ